MVFFNFENGLLRSAQQHKKILKENLSLAFYVLDSGDRHYLKCNEVMELLRELYTNYGDFRKHGVPNARKMRLLVAAMDINEDGRIFFARVSHDC